MVDNPISIRRLLMRSSACMSAIWRRAWSVLRYSRRSRRKDPLRVTYSQGGILVVTALF